MNNTVDRYVQLAQAAGMPMNQLTKFKENNYLVLPWALRFHALAREADRDLSKLFWILTGGARGPGKSHASLAQAGDDCTRFHGLKFLYLRQYKYKAGESMGDLASKIWSTDPSVKITKEKIEFTKTGSQIAIGGYNHPGDIAKYLGIQYDGGIFEEATQLGKESFKLIRGSIRSTIPGWKTRVYLSTNPGGIGHSFIKEQFIIPHREGKDHYYLDGKTAFIPGRYKDNPFLDDAYTGMLEALEGQLGKAWREGDWDSYEGMAFTQWNHKLHVVDPFDYPEWWPKWRAVDWGLHAPFCCQWFVKDPDIGRVYVVDEVYETQLTDKQQAVMITSRKGPEWNGVLTYADPASYWERKSDKEGKFFTSEDIYRQNGVPLTKADNNRTQGYRRFNNLLAKLPDGKPGIQYFDIYCSDAIRTIADIPSDPNHKEDVDTKAEDHSYDTSRYGTTNYQHKKKKPKARHVESPIEQLARLGRV